MKKFLLSFLCLFLIVSYSFAQRPPCPIDIKSNQGGGNCKPCTSLNDGSAGPLTNATAVITLTFNQPLTCTPRLLRALARDGETRNVRCGVGTVKSFKDGITIVEYCLYAYEESTGGRDGNFYNQPNLEVTLIYDQCGGGQTTCSEISNIPTPVKMKSFNARRTNGLSVALSWTTATESDNKGFYIQRKITGDWENVTFVASKAQGGNATTDISYTYTDANANKGVSQYRLKQEDHNGKTSLSEIRSVRGEEMASKALVYPNPSTEGGVNVVFDNARGERDVLVSDMSGRVIKQWSSITDNSMRISNLQPGTYTLRIFNKQDGSQQYEKLVINR